MSYLIEGARSISPLSTLSNKIEEIDSKVLFSIVI